MKGKVKKERSWPKVTQEGLGLKSMPLEIVKWDSSSVGMLVCLNSFCFDFNTLDIPFAC